MELTLDDLRGPEVGESRPITVEDLAALRAPKGAATPPRKKLRYKHHALARSLASGLGEATAAAITGFAPVTVSILKRDPAFAELVKFYASEEGKGFDHVRAQLLGVGQKFIEEMDRRVSRSPDELTMRDLRESGTVLLDRAGFGPAQSNTHDIHIHAGLADALQASRVNAPFPKDLLPAPEGGGHVPKGPVIEGEFEEVPKDFKWDE
jgi:hypothetical protein